MNVTSRSKTRWRAALVAVIAAVLGGCEAMHQSYDFTERMPTAMPQQVDAEDVWVTSIPEGADVYLQPYQPEAIPSHDSDPEAYRGKTPLSLPLSPGSYWIELAFDADVFDLFFDPPYDDAQFEACGSHIRSVTLPAPDTGRQTPRAALLPGRQAGRPGADAGCPVPPPLSPIERVAALYPQSEQFNLSSGQVGNLMQQLDVPPEAHEQLLLLLQRGGKVLWNEPGGAYKVALEARADEIQGQVEVLYSGAPMAGPTPAGRRRPLGEPVGDPQRLSITSMPPMNGCRTSGTVTLPSARWCTSNSGMRMRGEATTVLFRVCTKRRAPSPSR